MKKIFTLIIACIAAIAATAQTEGATTTWGLTGEGTEANPYCIYTADDLYTMAKNCNADHKGTGEYFVFQFHKGTIKTALFMSLNKPFSIAYCHLSFSKNISRILSSFIILMFWLLVERLLSLFG